MQGNSEEAEQESSRTPSRKRPPENDDVISRASSKRVRQGNVRHFSCAQGWNDSLALVQRHEEEWIGQGWTREKTGEDAIVRWYRSRVHVARLLVRVLEECRVIVSHCGGSAQCAQRAEIFWTSLFRLSPFSLPSRKTSTIENDANRSWALSDLVLCLLDAQARHDTPAHSSAAQLIILLWITSLPSVIESCRQDGEAACRSVLVTMTRVLQDCAEADGKRFVDARIPESDMRIQTGPQSCPAETTSVPSPILIKDHTCGFPLALRCWKRLLLSSEVGGDVFRGQSLLNDNIDDSLPLGGLLERAITMSLPSLSQSLFAHLALSVSLAPLTVPVQGFYPAPSAVVIAMRELSCVVHILSQRQLDVTLLCVLVNVLSAFLSYDTITLPSSGDASSSAFSDSVLSDSLSTFSSTLRTSRDSLPFCSLLFKEAHHGQSLDSLTRTWPLCVIHVCCSAIELLSPFFSQLPSRKTLGKSPEAAAVVLTPDLKDEASVDFGGKVPQLGGEGDGEADESKFLKLSSLFEQLFAIPLLGSLIGDTGRLTHLLNSLLGTADDDDCIIALLRISRAYSLVTDSTPNVPVASSVSRSWTDWNALRSTLDSVFGGDGAQDVMVGKWGLLHPLALFARYLHGIDYSHSVLFDMLASVSCPPLLEYILEIGKLCARNSLGTYQTQSDATFKGSKFLMKSYSRDTENSEIRSCEEEDEWDGVKKNAITTYGVRECCESLLASVESAAQRGSLGFNTRPLAHALRKILQYF